MIFSKHEGKRNRSSNCNWMLPSAVALTTCSLLPFVLLSPGDAQNLNTAKNRSIRSTDAYMQQQPADLSETRSMQAFGYVRAGHGYLPAPEAGVQLLETIFNRVMNIPQVALTKSTNSQIIAQNLKQQNSLNEKTNYSLAIRPKETGKVFAAPPPSLQIAQALPESKLMNQAPSAAPSLNMRQSAKSEMAAEGFAATEQWRGSAKIKPDAGNLLLADAPAKPGVWEESTNFPASVSSPRKNSMGYQRGAMLSQASSSSSTSAYGGTAPGGAGALSDSLLGDAGDAAGGAPTQRRVLPLATSVNKLYGLGKRLDEVQSLAQNANRVAELKTTKNKMDSREIAILDEKPVVRDFREAPEQQAYGEKESSKKRIALNSELSSVNGTLSSRARAKYSDSDSLSAGKDKVAMLPPNVVTGIPLGNVTLGKSEPQVVSSIGQIGKLRQHKVKNWTVYSWSKKHSDGKEALQLYFRKGTLEAIRIFDSSLIGTDFGVSPGDKLENVKERFGEPAFLLPEPGGSSKNYIYPISQVGFQLARTAESSPQVVSVLIFSVK